MKTLIDWSHWQDDKTGPPPDLSKAAGHGVDGFIFKAGRGGGTVTRFDIDPSFPEFVRQAVALGVPWGAYWWPEPHGWDPVGQAGLFFGTVEAAGRPELPYEVDVEGHRGSVLPPLELATWLRTFVDELRRLSGRSVTVYTRTGTGTRVFPAGVGFSDCALRVSHYFRGRRRRRPASGGRGCRDGAGTGAWVVDVVGVAVLGGREPGRRNVRGGVRRPRLERGARRRVRPVGAASRAGRRCVAGGVSGDVRRTGVQAAGVVERASGGGRSGEDRRVRGVDIGIVVGDWCRGGVVPAPVRVAGYAGG